MFHKREIKEKEVPARIVTETYEETKLLLPFVVDKISGNCVTLKFGDKFHFVYEGETFTVQIDLDQARLTT